MNEVANYPVETMCWPNGLRTSGGGTRTEVKLDRPWQVPLAVNQATCPFCTIRKDEPSLVPVEPGWRVIKNNFTPFPFHRLIIPSVCWPVEELWKLGGEEKIAEALSSVNTVMAAESHRNEMWLGVHIGYLAGQNVCHLHYHLLEPIATPRESSTHQLSKNATDEYLVYLDPHYSVHAGGVRAGQLIIQPVESASFDPSDLARVLSQIISRGNWAFQSKQERPPDFMVALRFEEGHFSWGFYLPIVNFWGFTEIFGLMLDVPLILPWPHAKTAEYFRER